MNDDDDDGRDGDDCDEVMLNKFRSDREWRRSEEH